MIKVLGRANSGNVQYVTWALAEIGVPFERSDVGGAFGGTDTPDFVAMNPNRLVPVLQDGELAMFESAAIVRYLGARYGSPAFWPTDPAERARLDQWAEWIKTSFTSITLPELFFPLIRIRAAERNHEAVRAAAEKLKPLAQMLDRRLEGVNYLGGKEPCFADIMVGTPLYRYFTLDFERAETPNLLAYYERLQTRPAYREHVMVSYDSLRVE
jgi:glutathione S-transferase